MANKPLSELDLKHLIEKTVNSQLSEKLGTLAIEMIKTRTRLGSGVPELGKAQQKLAPLADTTKVKRKREKAAGRLSSKTTPAKSNLTQTGELLDNIKFITSGKTLEIYIAGDRNRKVATYVADARPFFTLSKSEVSRLADVIQLAINSYLKQRT